MYCIENNIFKKEMLKNNMFDFLVYIYQLKVYFSYFSDFGNNNRIREKTTMEKGKKNNRRK